MQLACVEALRVLFRGEHVELQRFCTKGSLAAEWFVSQ